MCNKQELVTHMQKVIRKPCIELLNSFAYKSFERCPFQSFLMWLSQVDEYWNFFMFLCTKRLIFHHVDRICYEKITYNVMIIFEIVNKANQL